MVNGPYTNNIIGNNIRNEKVNTALNMDTNTIEVLMYGLLIQHIMVKKVKKYKP